MQNFFSDDDYLVFFDEPHLILSVYDYAFYDRSDIDMLGPAQRDYVARKLASKGYKWTSGRMLENQDSDYRVVFPRGSIQGASPADIMRFETRGENDIFVLTPTQTACYLLALEDKAEAYQKLEYLIGQQPINLEKMKDHLKHSPEYYFFCQIYPYLKQTEKELFTALAGMIKSHLGRRIF